MLKGPRNAAAFFVRRNRAGITRKYHHSTASILSLWIYAYKIDYVNYITPLIVEKLILSTPPLLNTKPIRGLEPPPEKALQPNCSEQ
jgi:dolichol kinase